MPEYILNRMSGIRIRDIIDIIIVAVLIYKTFELLKGTRAEQLSKGIIFLLVVTQVSNWLELYTINWILTNLMTLGMVAILIVFQPELRRGLEYLGRRSTFQAFTSGKESERPKVVDELTQAIASLSRQKIGALIVMENQTGLNEISDTGTPIHGDISTGLLINIFIPNTPLHDGAVVIRGEKIMAAACFLPLSDSSTLSKELGTRHRAALGMSERSDALCLVVSEETGSISVAQYGKLSRHLDIPTLEEILEDHYNPSMDHTFDFFRKTGVEGDHEK